jgi:hypothetical protein
MKSLVVVAFLCTTSLVQADEATTPTTIDGLVVVMQPLAMHHLLKKDIAAVTKELPRMRRVVWLADSILQVDSLQIDLIGQLHYQPNQTPEQAQKMLCSQKHVYALLDSLNVDIIGNEGMVAGRVTVKSIRDTVTYLLRKNGQTLAPEVIEERLQKWIQTEGAVQYLWGHDRCYLIGTENQVLNNLMARYFKLLSSHEGLELLPQAADFQKLGQALRTARTEVALALMIIELHQAGLRHGAVVLGQAHYADYQQITARYPTIRWSYFPTSDAPWELDR